MTSGVQVQDWELRLRREQDEVHGQPVAVQRQPEKHHPRLQRSNPSSQGTSTIRILMHTLRLLSLYQLTFSESNLWNEKNHSCRSSWK